MGLLKWINDGIEARNERERKRQEEAAERRRIEAEEAQKKRAEAEHRRAEEAARHLANVLALFEDKSNQASIPVTSFFAMYDKPHKLKAPYVERFAGAHSGIQTQNTAAAIGSIVGSSVTAYKRASLETGMEHFEIARYVYDLSDKDMAMLKIVNFMHAMGRVTDKGFHGVTCAILYNGGDCILRGVINPNTQSRVEFTNIQEMACKACLHDNMPSKSVAFDPVFQAAVPEWKKIEASGEIGELNRRLLGDPLAVIMS